jgi:hypothetical protein
MKKEKRKKKKNFVSPNMNVSDGPFPIIKVVQNICLGRDSKHIKMMSKFIKKKKRLKSAKQRLRVV